MVAPSFKVGDKVEVRSDEVGFLGVWYVAEIVHMEGSGSHKAAVVEYEQLLDERGQPLQESAPIRNLRPPPPPPSARKPCWLKGDRVEAYDKDGWWEGTVTRVLDKEGPVLVYFQNSGEELGFPLSKLRRRKCWKDGVWTDLTQAERHRFQFENVSETDSISSTPTIEKKRRGRKRKECLPPSAEKLTKNAEQEELQPRDGLAFSSKRKECLPPSAEKLTENAEQEELQPWDGLTFSSKRKECLPLPAEKVTKNTEQEELQPRNGLTFSSEVEGSWCDQQLDEGEKDTDANNGVIVALAAATAHDALQSMALSDKSTGVQGQDDINPAKAGDLDYTSDEALAATKQMEPRQHRITGMAIEENIPRAQWKFELHAERRCLAGVEFEKDTSTSKRQAYKQGSSTMMTYGKTRQRNTRLTNLVPPSASACIDTCEGASEVGFQTHGKEDRHSEDVKPRRIELDAYQRLLQAFRSKGPFDWKQELLLSEVRCQLEITNMEHASVLKEVLYANDELEEHERQKTELANSWVLKQRLQ